MDPPWCDRSGRPGRFLVVVAGWGGPDCGAVGLSLDGPVGVVFEVVVAAAQGVEVGLVGGAAVGPGVDVVEFAVAGGRVQAGKRQVRSRAMTKSGNVLRWLVAGAAVVDQVSGGVGDQAVPGAGGVGGEVAGQGGGDGSVAVEFGGLVVDAQQCGQGDADLDRRAAARRVGTRLSASTARSMRASARRWSIVRSSPGSLTRPASASRRSSPSPRLPQAAASRRWPSRPRKGGAAPGRSAAAEV